MPSRTPRERRRLLVGEMPPPALRCPVAKAAAPRAHPPPRSAVALVAVASPQAAASLRDVRFAFTAPRGTELTVGSSIVLVPSSLIEKECSCVMYTSAHTLESSSVDAPQPMFLIGGGCLSVCVVASLVWWG